MTADASGINPVTQDGDFPRGLRGAIDRFLGKCDFRERSGRHIENQRCTRRAGNIPTFRGRLLEQIGREKGNGCPHKAQKERQGDGVSAQSHYRVWFHGDTYRKKGLIKKRNGDLLA